MRLATRSSVLSNSGSRKRRSSSTATRRRRRGYPAFPSVRASCPDSGGGHPWPPWRGIPPPSTTLTPAWALFVFWAVFVGRGDAAAFVVAAVVFGAGLAQGAEDGEDGAGDLRAPRYDVGEVAFGDPGLVVAGGFVAQCRSAFEQVLAREFCGWWRRQLQVEGAAG